MTQILKVKVIKKGTVRAEPTVVKSKLVAKREVAREMVSTVTTWVNDLQQRKRDETKLALEQLFGQHARPNES